MLTEYNSQDAQRLHTAKLARFQTFVLTDLNITVNEDCLIFRGADPNIVIAQSNSLIQQAAIILGTSKLKIYDTASNLLLAAELKSEEIHKSEEAMTVATVSRSVEFDLAPTQEMPNVVPWNRITSITGETEEELRLRLQALGTPFYWSDDSWAVAHETASQLVIHFRMEQGRHEAATLLTEEQTNGRKQEPKAKTDNGSVSNAEPSKPEFQPLKRGVTPTLEKYLTFAGDTESKRAEILGDIAQENTKGKRHLTKIVNSYPPDMEKPTRGEFQVAAKKLMAKRAKQLTSVAETSETEEAVAE
ncbi:hypothetical protein [Nostoc sp. GT001]|uniref:hypothetical protein n=1 Tax=Nostoc sp. GT001 TaxID=3056647 RepID=UPI0025AACFED|nr:hypothetical protein [Nostoc sp. GT001]MDM9583157.1 hypothetical protein [Nostoc sp. GT001]